MVCLNFQLKGFPVNPKRRPKMSSDVALRNEMFGEMSCLMSAGWSMETFFVVCESLLFHGYARPSLSSKT